MKYISYTVRTRINHGTTAAPIFEEIVTPKRMEYSEKNLAIVQAEAYNGVYTIEDDGVEESAAEPTTEERLDALEAALLDMIMGGATNG